MFISYGVKCNDELLEKYGFILEDNDDTCVHLDFNSFMEELEEVKEKGFKNDAEEALWKRRKALLEEKADEVASDYSFQILPTAVTQEVIFVAEILSFAEGILSRHLVLMFLCLFFLLLTLMCRSDKRTIQSTTSAVAHPEGHQPHPRIPR